MPALLALLLILAVKVLASSVDEWISEMFIAQRSIAGVFESSPVGLRYNRGFPRGIWGTNLVPDLGAYDEVNKQFLVNGFFWNMAKEWLALDANWHDPQAAFDTFRRRVFDYMCEGGTWACCTAGVRDVSCRDPPKPMQDVIFTLMDPTENMPVIFLFWWCANSWVTFRRMDSSGDAFIALQLKRSILQFCPSPCLAKPCRWISGVDMPNVCKVVGPFEDDYECICRREFVWDQDTRTCKAINPCFVPIYAPCSIVGTLTCVALDMQHAKCICKAGYMGKDCAQLRNACLMRFNETEPNGNTNCGVAHGNLCNPVLGTDFYKCICTTGWIPSSQLPYDNCALLNDPCGAVTMEEEEAGTKDGTEITTPKVLESISCQHGGYCISSADFSRAACLCPTTVWGDQMYTGTYCETPRGVWSSWTRPSECRAKNCGISRYRWRRRQCQNDTYIDDPSEVSYKKSYPCFGISEEVLPCDELLPCSALRMTGLFRNEIFYFNRLCIFLLIVALEFLITFVLVKTCGLCIVHFVLKKIEKRKPLIVHEVEPCSRDQSALEERVEANELPPHKVEVCLKENDFDKKRAERDYRMDENLPIAANMGGIGGNDNEEFLRSLRQTIIERVLRKIGSVENERSKNLQPLLHSKGQLLWKQMKSRLGYRRELLRRKVKAVERQRQMIGKTLEDPFVSDGMKSSSLNEETVELRGDEPQVFKMMGRAPNVDVASASDKRTTRGKELRDGQRGRLLRIDEGAQTRDAQENSPSSRLCNTIIAQGTPLDPQTTLKRSQLFELPKEDFEAQGRRTPMKSRLFRYSDHANELESIKLSTVNERELQRKLPIVKPESGDAIIPPKHLKMLLKGRKGPRIAMPPSKLPFFSSDTLDQISWSEFTGDLAHENTRDSRVHSPQAVAPDKPVPPIIVISSPSLEQPHTNDDGVTIKPEALENVELESPPIIDIRVAIPSTQQELCRPSDKRHEDLKGGDEVMEASRSSLKKESLSTAHLNLGSTGLRNYARDFDQNRIQSDPSDSTKSERKFPLSLPSPIPEASPIPLSSADKRIPLAGTHGKKDVGEDGGSMSTLFPNMEMADQRSSKPFTNNGTTVKYKRTEEHVHMRKSNYQRLHQSSQNRHRQEQASESAEDSHGMAVHARIQPKGQPKPTSITHSSLTPPGQNL